MTKMSDVELYENRTEFEFDDGAGLSEHLPKAETPEQQVADASLYDFFRLVRFHGGKNPYFTWHEETPVLELVRASSGGHCRGLSQ